MGYVHGRLYESTEGVSPLNAEGPLSQSREPVYVACSNKPDSPAI
jgi:hypothetical protein